MSKLFGVDIPRPGNCPACKSENITPGKLHCGQGGDAWQPSECNDCGANWERLFQFFAIANIEDAEGNEVDR